MKKKFPKGHKLKCGCVRCSNARGIPMMLGKKHSEETKKKISESRKGKSPNHKADCKCPFCHQPSGENHPMYGKHFSDETKQKISDKKKGISTRGSGWKVSEETKEKMRQARKNHKEDCMCGSCRASRGNHPFKGKSHSSESRQKMSNSSKGCNSNSGSFKKGHIPWMKGRHLSDESKKKLSESLIGHIPWNKGLTKESDERVMMISKNLRKSDLNSGENHSNWRGGVSKFNHLIRNSVEMDEWRESIFRRDDWTCQLCHEWGGVLRAHHIKSYSDIIAKYNIKSVNDSKSCEELWDISNGITVCDYCHKWIHSLKPLNQQ